MIFRFFSRSKSTKKSAGPYKSTFRSRSELLEARMMLAGDVVQNLDNPNDVNADGIVTARDAAVLAWKMSTSRGALVGFEQAAGEPSPAPIETDPEMFYDVTGNGVLSQGDFESVVQALNAEGEPGDVVTFHLRTTDLSGSPISSIDVGSEFILNVLVQDTQTDEPPGGFGVFAAFLDVEYDAALASVTADLEFGAIYTNQRQGGTSAAGLIDEAGAFANFDPPGNGEIQLFSVRMRADNAGTLLFTSNVADSGAAVDIGVFGSNDPVSPNDILYGGATLQIAGVQQDPQDLVAFAKALADAGVELWTSTLDARGETAQQLDLFEEGQHFLPIKELVEKNPDDQAELVGTVEAGLAGRFTQNIWVFPDDSESNGELLTLEQVSARAGVPIPLGSNPSLVPIDDVTVLQGSPLHIPLDGYDPDGDDLTYTITVDNGAAVETTILDGNRSIRFFNEEEGGYLGEMVLQFFEGRASRATDRIITLAEDGFYDGITYHRVINEFVLQAGDPTATGSGGSTLGDFDDQFHVDLQHNRTGILSMAKSSDDTNDSQFFITEGPTRHLDFNHTIFGQLVEGERVRETISNVSTAARDVPVTTVSLANVQIFRDNENAVAMLKALQSTGTATVTVTASDPDGNSSSDTFTVTLDEDVINGSPFLDDFTDQTFLPDEAAEFQVTAQDVEGDAIKYEAFINGDDATLEIDDTGFVTAGGFVGTLDALIQVSAQDPTVPGEDQQFFTISIGAEGPRSVDLLAVTDSGTFADDNITNITDLQFEVAGVTSGATVVVLSDGIEVGRGVATGDTITITTSNPSAIGSGIHVITAAVEIDSILSLESPAVSLTLDQEPPAELSNVAPTTGAVGSNYVFDAEHEDEGTADAAYSLASNAPAGMEIDPSTGEVTWLPTGDQAGTQTFDVVVQDRAGNTKSTTFQVEVEGGAAAIRLVATDVAGNEIANVAEGESFQLQVFVEDQRADPQGIDQAYVDISFGGTLARVDTATGVQIGSSFPDGVETGTVSSTAVTNVGGTTTAPLGAGQVLLATIPFIADAIGPLTIDVVANGNGVSFFNQISTLPDGDLQTTGVTIDILEVTAALAANDDAFTLNEDSGETVLDVLANDELGPNSVVLEILSRTTPNNGGSAVISADSRTILYTPAQDFEGEEQFNYTAMDALGEISTATVTLTVNAVNDPPVANDDFYPADLLPYDPDRDGTPDPRLLLVEDGTEEVWFFVIGNDSVEPDSGDFAEITSVESSTSTVRIVSELLNTQVAYTPGPNVSGEDTFTYTFTDDGTPPASAVGTVTVTVARVNDFPVANSDAFEVPRGRPTTIAAAEIVGNDSPGPLESDQTLEIVDVRGATQGTVELTADGSILYTPNADATGADTLVYTIRDNGETDVFQDPNTLVAESDPLESTGVITFTYVEGNQEPDAFDDSLSVVGGSSGITVDVLQNDRDDGGTSGLSIVSFDQGTAGGKVELVDRSLRYTPDPTFIGVDTFTYTISDGDFTDSATVRITVTDPATTTNSRFTGFVFQDGNNNGVMDSGEQGLGAVNINLSGTDTAGNLVSRSVLTDFDGRYSFDSLPEGLFTVTQSQPALLLDGVDTANALSSEAGNDAFTITVGDSIVTSDNNSFAERGLSPKLAILDALSSNRGGDGFLTAITDGASQFVRDAVGWDEYSQIRLTMSDDGADITIEATDKDSQKLEVTFSASDRSKVRLLGRDADSVLLRISAAASAFDLVPSTDA